MARVRRDGTAGLVTDSAEGWFTEGFRHRRPRRERRARRTT